MSWWGSFLQAESIQRHYKQDRNSEVYITSSSSFDGVPIDRDRDISFAIMVVSEGTGDMHRQVYFGKLF